ncbi:hypothetical protein PTKIN_Ptkin08bG0072200 [Pterospermum kingtungense]
MYFFCQMSMENFASYSKVARGIQVKSFHDEHSRAVSFENHLANRKMIVECFESTIKKKPKIKSKDIQGRIRDELHVYANLTVYQRAKRMVLKKLAGNFEEEYVMLRNYAGELLDKNLGSTCIVKIDKVTPESQPFFKGLYVCFDALKKG